MPAGHETRCQTFGISILVSIYFAFEKDGKSSRQTAFLQWKPLLHVGKQPPRKHVRRPDGNKADDERPDF